MRTYLKCCKRCQIRKEPSTCFIRECDHPDVCKVCLTDAEIIEWATPEISKIMKDLTPREKKEILKSIIQDYKRKQKEKK